ncbi:MAG: hypothetical protein AAGF12_18955 [Myxococcota bacterium]
MKPLPLLVTLWGFSAFVTPASAQFELEDPTGQFGDDETEEEGELDEEAELEEEGLDEEEESEAEEEAAEEAEAESEPPQEPPTEEQEVEVDEEEDEEEGPRGGVTTGFGPPPQEAGEEDSRLLIPPLLIERSGDVSTTAVYPFYFNRSSPDDNQLLIGPYYQRRGLELNADVLFPIFWSFRGVDSLTLSVPPFYYHNDEDGFDWGLAPLIFDGRSGDSVYTIIPPLLTVSWADEENAQTIAGPYWRFRSGEDVSWGIFPLLWTFQDEGNDSIIFPPLFFRFTDEEEETATTVVPPVYHRSTAENAYFGAAGLFHYYSDNTGGSLTLPPLLTHYSKFEDDIRLITPLFGYTDVDDTQTLITPLYQRYRGQTYFDGIAPIFFSIRDPRDSSSALVIPPLFWAFDDPAGATTILAPFFARFHNVGQSTTWITPLVGNYQSHEEDSAGTWIFPNIQVSHTPNSNTVNIHPLFYSTTASTHRHLVITPLYWDIEDYEDDSRATVMFPFFWRFRSGSSVHQVAGNTFYRHFREGGVSGFEFHFFPLFSYGVPRPGDHWWQILYGLVGYERQGEYARGRVFYIPFETDGPE